VKEKSAHLHIISGIPGQGKSTLARKLVEEGKADCYFEADMYMVDESGEYSFNARKLGYCHNQCQKMVQEALEKGLRVIVSNTSLTKKEAAPYVNMARELCATIQITHMPIDVVYGSIHGVPDWKVEIMKDKKEFYTLEDFD
jgi:predicted kinase